MFFFVCFCVVSFGVFCWVLMWMSGFKFVAHFACGCVGSLAFVVGDCELQMPGPQDV